MKRYRNKLQIALPSGERLYTLLAVCLIAIILVIYALYIALTIIPDTRTRQDLVREVDAARKAVATAQAAQGGTADSLRQKIASAQARRDAAAVSFMAESQAAALSTALYDYAGESGITLASLSSSSPRREKGIYDVRTLHVQATGPLPQMVYFFSRIREASLKGFTIAGLKLTRKDERYDLSMDLVLYTSSYAPMAQLASAPTMTPRPTPQPSATATVAPSATAVPHYVEYVVCAGDTLYSLARRHGTTVQAIMAANGLSTSAIRAGQQLRIPVP